MPDAGWMDAPALVALLFAKMVVVKAATVVMLPKVVALVKQVVLAEPALMRLFLLKSSLVERTQRHSFFQVQRLPVVPVVLVVKALTVTKVPTLVVLVWSSCLRQQL